MRLTFALAALAASLVACSSSSSPPDTTPSPEIIARFDPGAGSMPLFLDVPYPSDVYLDADGTLSDTLPGLDQYLTQNAASIEAALAPTRGYGVNSGAMFRVDRAHGDG